MTTNSNINTLIYETHMPTQEEWEELELYTWYLHDKLMKAKKAQGELIYE